MPDPVDLFHHPEVFRSHTSEQHIKHRIKTPFLFNPLTGKKTINTHFNKMGDKKPDVRCPFVYSCLEKMYSVAISPCGVYSYGGGADKNVSVFETESGKHIHEFEGPETDKKHAVEDLCPSPCGRVVYARTGYGVLVYDLETWELSACIETTDSRCIAAAVDGSYLFVGTACDVRCYKYGEYVTPHKELPFNEGCTSSGLLVHNTRLYCTAEYRTEVWDVPTLTKVHELCMRADCLRVSGEVQYHLVPGEMKVQLREAESLKEMRSINLATLPCAKEGRLDDISLSPDGKLLYLLCNGNFTGGIIVYDITAAKFLGNFFPGCQLAGFCVFREYLVFANNAEMGIKANNTYEAVEQPPKEEEPPVEEPKQETVHETEAPKKPAPKPQKVAETKQEGCGCVVA